MNKPQKLAAAIMRTVNDDDDADAGTVVDALIICTAAALANVEQLSLDDIDRLTKKGAQKIADLARHFRKEGEIFQ
jgi:hypothetical protein